ncbi:glycosyltransferase family 4 protein [Flavobacterium aquatile]|uniref:Glycosyl transferase n=1 Tax=Flavobacterium aquatile LMG 4008 = ATCC 11947 TaxID=1453498 RepID=A0A095SUX8_9FLAO|nr:glycosyltransferase [Flavobacterium aquatile]KGD68154.1 glycosyl transferase [Flavobacterium aquatile LMG 4008 = ATCC 11947]OXA68909.1 glycosyl transferase [Flavobacterium aquatile] [Flavobacterium aquatile LMG 4008 = ATCC 11947]GEC77376.1 glycosyl transferase [Flavobacterium aquatile]
MTFCIITHVLHTKSNGDYFGYAPYIDEMNIWLKYVDKVVIVAPLKNFENTAIHQKYKHQNIEFIVVPDFSLTSFGAICKTILNLPKILFLIFKAMNKSDHLHLRCPGNMGLLGSLVQILFPKKKKTAKYAGNWDAKSKQPFTYRLQKYILSSTFLTKNMQVLVYGTWEKQTGNIKSFFTATYLESDKVFVDSKSLNDRIHFVFVGSLTAGKQPIEVVKIVEKLKSLDYNVVLSIYGEGAEKQNLEDYIVSNNLSEVVFLEGNVTKEAMKKVYQKSHFLILNSKSEGWPKVVAEAMFWGCLPIASQVSCIPTMLDYGNRGVLLTNSFENDSIAIEMLLKNQTLYDLKIKEAINWSRNFTIDKFDSEIKKLVTS